jgi:hypothetical protein
MRIKTISEVLKMKELQKGIAVLAAVVFVFAGAVQVQAQMGGHDPSMAREDPNVFIRDIERAFQDILNQIKAGRTMDARNSLTRLTTATDKLLTHVTDAALKKILGDTVNGIKADVNSGSPDPFDLEDKGAILDDTLKQITEILKGME